MSFTNYRIGTRLSVGFGLVILLLAGVAILGLVSMGRTDDALHRIADVNVRQMALLEDMAESTQTVASAVRTIALLNDPEVTKVQGETIAAARGVYDAAYQTLEQMSLDERSKAFVSRLKAYRSEVRPLNDKFIELSRTSEDEAAQFLLNVAAPATAKWQNTLREYTEFQRVKNRNDEDAAVQTYHAARLIMVSLTGLSIMFGIFIAGYSTRLITHPLRDAVRVAQNVAAGDLTSRINVCSSDETGQLMQALKEMNGALRNIVGQVRTGADTITSAANQIAGGNADLSTRTERQASSLEKTATSMEVLTSTVKRNADSARSANTLATSASAVACKGGAVVAEVVFTMKSINESSNKIVEIISVIDGIAFQTNILALNAAVEAARAGEQGRGFAVVAAEVRNLAQRSAAAAREIKILIGASVERVDVGCKLVDQAGATMNQVVESVKRVSDIIGEIADASHEQTIGIEEVRQAVIQMDNVTQQNSALVEEAAASAASMQQQAADLTRVVSAFKFDNASDVNVSVLKQPIPESNRFALPDLHLNRPDSQRDNLSGSDVELL